MYLRGALMGSLARCIISLLVATSSAYLCVLRLLNTEREKHVPKSHAT